MRQMTHPLESTMIRDLTFTYNITTQKDGLYHYPYSTGIAQLPTWAQFKKLAFVAKELMTIHSYKSNHVTLFLIMLTLLVCHSSNATSTPYWAFFPNPPTFHPVTWDKDPIKIHVNDTEFFGGPGIPGPPFDFITAASHNFTYLGTSSTTPICFTSPAMPSSWPYAPDYRGCINTQIGGMVLDKKASETIEAHALPESIEKWPLWTLQMLIPGKEPASIVVLPSPRHRPQYHQHPKGYPNCNKNLKTDKPDSEPCWINCMYNSTRSALYASVNESLYVHDWSAHDPDVDYRFYYRNSSIFGPTTESFNPSFYYHTLLPINKISTVGWTVPILHANVQKMNKYQPNLWKAIAANQPISLYYHSPISSLHSNDKFLKACIQPPYAFLIANDSYSVHIKKKKRMFLSPLVIIVP